MRLLEKVSSIIRALHYSYRTEKSYVYWIRQYILFHSKEAGKWVHPSNLQTHHINDCLTYLAVKRKVAASTQNQAFSALLFSTSEFSKLKSMTSKPSGQRPRKDFPLSSPWTRSLGYSTM